MTSMPHKFEVAKAPGTVHGVVVKVDPKTGKAEQITRLQMAHV